MSIDNDETLGAELGALARPQGDLAARLMRRALEARLFATQAPLPTLGRFEVRALLGRGGMGAVYLAWDPRLERQVALKVIPVAGDADDARLLAEARAMARLSHPNVLAVFDAERIGDDLVIALEWIDGTDLRRLRERPSWQRALDLLIPVARGLHAAHLAGIVHRDVKPDNVLVDRAGRARIGDFGLARPEAHGPASGSATRRAGTPAYMAPEQRAGKVADARSDQYAFCLTLAELVGERGPARLGRALARGRAVDPAARWPSLAALADELERARAGPRRRIALAVLGACLVAGLGLGALRPGAAAPCSGARGELAGVWDASVIARAEAAFARSSRPYARQAWASARAQLDAYASAWVAAHDDSCQATRVRRSQSEAMLDRRMACLAQRKQELAAVAALLAEPDQQVIERAVALAGTPGDLASCADLAALEQVPLPASATARAQVAALRGELAQVDALRAAGRFDAALILSAPLGARAGALGYRPLEAEVLYLQGVLWDARSGPRVADALFSRAVWAAEASGHDELAVRSLSRLAGTATREARWSDAESALARASAAVERGHGRPSLRLYLLQGEGFLRLRQARDAEAAAAYDQAAALAEKLYGPIDQRVTFALNQAGIALENQEKLDEALAHYRKAGQAQVEASGTSHPEYAMTLVNFAVIAQMRERYGEALADLGAALVIVSRSMGPSQRLADIEGEYGNVYFKLGRYDLAAEHHRRAVAIGRQVLGNEDATVARYLANLGRNLRLAGDLPGARQALEEALAVDRAALGNEHPQVANAIMSLGLLLDDAGDLAGATRYFLEARDVLARVRPGSHELAMAHLNVSRALLESDPQASLAAAEAAIAIDETTLEDDQPGRSASLIYAGMALAALHRLPEARARYLQAIGLMTGAEGDYAEELIETRWLLSEIDPPHRAELRALVRAACQRAQQAFDRCKSLR